MPSYAGPLLFAISTKDNSSFLPSALSSHLLSHCIMRNYLPFPVEERHIVLFISGSGCYVAAATGKASLPFSITNTTRQIFCKTRVMFELVGQRQTKHAQM